MAGLIYFCSQVTKPAFPLKGYSNHNIFKVYSVDTGLICRMVNLPVQAILDKTRLFTEYSGALAENYAASQLKASGMENLYYWTNPKGQAEVDFIIENHPDIIPVEVKSGEGRSLKSK